MAFQFRFMSLLKKREYSLQDAQTALAAAQQRYGEIKRGMDIVKENYQKAWSDWQQEQHRGIEARFFLVHTHYLKSLEQQLLFLETELIEAHKEMEKRKLQVLEKDKDVNVLQELQTQDRRSYNHARFQREQKQMDEIAVFKDFRCRTL